jgi:hypothetical protein
LAGLVNGETHLAKHWMSIFASLICSHGFMDHHCRYRLYSTPRLMKNTAQIRGRDGKKKARKRGLGLRF